MQDQRKDVDHFPVAARFAQHLILQQSEGGRNLSKARATPDVAPWI